jgi:uncharacterized cofD-like protein
LDGTTTVGQYAIEETRLYESRPKLYLEPRATLNPEAKSALETADVIIIAPGNLYASLAPALLVEGVGETLRSSKAKLMYICNLVTKPGQTDGLQVHDYAREIERFIGGPALDCVVYNNRQPSQALLDKYARKGEYAVSFDQPALDHMHYQMIGEDLISNDIPHINPAEQIIPRTLIRHDSDRLARLIMATYITK